MVNTGLKEVMAKRLSCLYEMRGFQDSEKLHCGLYEATSAKEQIVVSMLKLEVGCRVTCY